MINYIHGTKDVRYIALLAQVVGMLGYSQFIFEHLPQSFGRERFHRVLTYLDKHDAVSSPRVGYLALSLESPCFPCDRRMGYTSYGIHVE